MDDYKPEHNVVISSWANKQEQAFLELEPDWQGTHEGRQRMSDRCPTRKFVDKVVFCGDEMVGAFIATISSKEIMLTNIITNPDFRGLGIAKLTVKELIQNYKEIFDVTHDVNLVKTNVKFGNEKVKDLFESVGFKFQDLPGCELHCGKYKVLKHEQLQTEEIAQ